MTLARWPIRFRRLERGDFAFLADWFARDRVAPWWQEPADLAAIEARYGPAIDGQDATDVYIVELDRTPIGLIQRYLVDDDPAWRSTLAPANAPAPAAGIDYLIGEQTHTGHGLGPFIIDRFLRTPGGATPPSSPSWSRSSRQTAAPGERSKRAASTVSGREPSPPTIPATAAPATSTSEHARNHRHQPRPNETELPLSDGNTRD